MWCVGSVSGGVGGCDGGSSMLNLVSMCLCSRVQRLILRTVVVSRLELEWRCDACGHCDSRTERSGVGQADKMGVKYIRNTVPSWDFLGASLASEELISHWSVCHAHRRSAVPYDREPLA